MFMAFDIILNYVFYQKQLCVEEPKYFLHNFFAPVYLAEKL